ncbi:MAG: hypothetical protein LC793_24170 [Thermomicrobia bacterium]|nr:hypothetical protein [Thermomicrobia bacterium]
MNQWWRDPVEARRVARWSFPAICALGAYAAVGPVGGLIGFLLIPVIFTAAFFEARGSLFFLQFAHLRPPDRKRGPVWLPWLGMLLGGIALIVAGSWLSGIAHEHLSHVVGQAVNGAAIAGAGALFFASLFTLLGYWIDKELAGWVERQGEDEMPEQFRNKRRKGRND